MNIYTRLRFVVDGPFQQKTYDRFSKNVHTFFRLLTIIRFKPDLTFNKLAFIFVQIALR